MATTRMHKINMLINKEVELRLGGGLPYHWAMAYLLRNGFYDGEQWTLAKIGERFGVSAERVREWEAMAKKRTAIRFKSENERWPQSETQ